MEDNPQIKIKGTNLDIALETIALLLFLISLVYTFYLYSVLPDEIPHHYNFNGEPDAWGSKNLIFVLLGIQTFQYGLLTLIAKYPHMHNYMVKITLENAVEMYTKGMRFLRGLKILLMILFFAVIYENGQSAQNEGGNLGWPFYTSFTLLIAYIFIYIVNQLITKRNH